MMTRRGQAKLYINDEFVGDVFLQRTEDSWAHGHFHPDQAFARFALLFGQWSLMMHADGAYERLSETVSDELRRIEVEIDRLRAKLHFVESDRWVTCSQLNIDGPLIEWKSS